VNRAAARETLPPDPFPKKIEIHRARRRSVELALQDGVLVARAPQRMPAGELREMLGDLRVELWRQYRGSHCFGVDGLVACATKARKRWLADIDLPGFTVRFAGRMRKRWASCTAPVAAGAGGSIRVSQALEGHPNWLLEHLLLHELIHLLHPNHGAEFRRLMARSPLADRASGYLEALTGNGEWGRGSRRGRIDGGSVVEALWNEEEGQPPLPLFDS
jgi:hypothetical protein